MKAVALVVVVLVVAAGAAAASPDPNDPSEIVVVLDRSAAMKGERFDLARAAIADMVDSLTEHDKVAVVVYGKRPVIAAAMGSASRARIETALAGLTTDGAQADAAAAIDTAVALFASDKLGLAHHVVLLTAHDPATGGIVGKLAKQHATISTIAVQADTHAVLSELARSTKGGAYVAGDLIDLHRFAIAAAHVPARPLPPAQDMAMALVVDRSESMRGPMLDMAIETARVMVEVLDPAAFVSVIAFDTEASVVVPPQRASNRMRISVEIGRIQAKGSTSYGPAFKEALAELTGINVSNKYLVLFTDGGDEDTDLTTHLAALDKANVKVIVVGVDNHHLARAKTIAERGHGTLITTQELQLLPRMLLQLESRVP